MDIQAAIAIPILRSYGQVKIQVNDEGALLEGDIQFLEVLNPTVTIKWDWAFTNFYAELGNIIFAQGVLELNQLLLDVETKPSLVLFFNIDITVLSFAGFGATCRMVSLKIYSFFHFYKLASTSLTIVSVSPNCRKREMVAKICLLTSHLWRTWN